MGTPRKRGAPARRRDDRGHEWTQAQVESESCIIVAELEGGDPAIDRGTRFLEDLGWDATYKLNLIDPVRERLHESLPRTKVKALKTVGGLVDLVWDRMEPVVKRKLKALLLPLVAAGAVEAQQIRVGRSYTSSTALAEPATLVAEKSGAGPWLTKLDLGILATTDASDYVLGVGFRTLAGSARAAKDRLIGFLLSGERPVGSFEAVLAGEYQMDGPGDVQKGLLDLQVTPNMPNRIGLGNAVRWGRLDARWRPWLGAGVGNVFKTDGSLVREDSGAFFRGQLRLEVMLRFRLGATWLEATGTGTAWYVEGFNGTNSATTSLSLPFGDTGASLTVGGEFGRRPPRFEKVSELSVGIGYRVPVPP